MKAGCIGALILSGIVPGIDLAHAQSTEPTRLAQQRPPGTPREQLRAQANENVMHLMGGQLGSGYIVMAHDISIVVNDSPDLRVIPGVGGAGVQNVRDVVFLKGVDLGITNVLVLNKLKETRELGPNLDSQVAYIAPLFPETMQVLVRPEINTIEDLRGKRVSFNNADSATAAFSPLVFKALNIDVQVMNMAQGDAIEKMRSGELEATVCTCPVPIPAYATAKAEWGFKFINIPYVPALENNYYPASIKSTEYPNLVPKGSQMATIATYSVLIAFNWPRGSTRYNRVAKFTDTFFSKFENLQKPPRHPLWKSVNLSATIPGWQRFPAAQDWLNSAKKADSASARANSPKLVEQKAPQSKEDPMDPAVQEQVFKEFIEWRKRAK